MGNLEALAVHFGGQAVAAACHNAQALGALACGATLVAPVEGQLQPQADTQKGNSSGNLVAHGVHLAHLLHGSAGIGKGAHAGQHHAVSGADGRGVVGDDDVGPGVGQAPLHRAEVSLVVVDDRDGHRHLRAHSVPLVEGTSPARRGSSSTAWRSA